MRSFRIGRVFGIDLRVDWSWVFIFLLLTFNLDAVFSRWHADWSPVEAFVVAATASIVFFGCVVLHELAHSLVAKSFGVTVRSITLFLFGGVSNIEREPPSALAEFVTAIAGPIMSIVLGAGALILSFLIAPAPITDSGSAWSAFAGLGPVGTLLAWLGPINIVIGLFNLIPGFPLDGGRVLRSILWGLTGDLHAATRWAAAGGQAIGWVFIAAGIAMSFGAQIPFFGTGLASGIWLAFIGWFLRGAATQAATRLALDDALAGVTVEQLMQRDGPRVTSDLSVAALVQAHLVPGDDRALPVIDAGVLVGLVSIADVRRVAPERWASTRLSAIMRRADELVVATPDEPLATAFEQLALRDIEQMPVVVHGQLVGMLRRRDIGRWLELAWRPAAGVARGPGAGGTPLDPIRRHLGDGGHAGHPA